MRLAPIRATARIAWRQARRSPWRSALIVAMVALPIAALSATSIVIRTVMPTAEERATEAMGTANIIIQGWSEDLKPEALLRELPTGTRVITGKVLYSQNVVRGSMLYLRVEEFPPRIDRPPMRGRYAMLEGRAPERAGEAALQPDALAAFGAHIGDDVRLEDVGLTLHVTGTVIEPGQADGHLAVVGPGTLVGQKEAGIEGFWIDLPPGVPLDQATSILSNDNLVHGFSTRSQVAHLDDGARTVANGGAFGAAALALFGTGLIAAAAFVVGARRQLRLLGLIGAVGGEPRHIRATVLFGGTALGLVGSLVGVGLGIAGAFAIHPYFSGITGRLVGAVEVPPLLLLGAVALGTLAATLAAFGPARSAAKLSVVQALAGLTPPPRAPGKLAGTGLIAAAGGGGLIAVGTTIDSNSSMIAGQFLMLGGFLVALPLLVTWVGKLARYLPTVPRLAARNIARNGRRTGAAMAAATIALALPVAISAITLSDEAAERKIPFMANDQLLVSLETAGGDQENRSRALLHDLRTAFLQSLVVPLEPAVFSPERFHLPSAQGADQPEEWTVLVQGGHETVSQGVDFTRYGSLLIGRPDLLRAFHAAGGIPDLRAGRIVAIGPRSTDGGVVHLVLPPGEGGTELLLDLPAVEAGPTRYASLGSGGEYNYVISSEAAARLGLEPSRSSSIFQSVFRSPQALSKGDLARAKRIAARHPGAYVISAGDLGSHSGRVRLYATMGGGVVALAIVAVVIALVAAESRRDQAILVAVGAAPGIRRALSGANAVMLAGVAALVAVPAGFAPVAIVEAARKVASPVVIPWSVIGIVVLGVPILSGTMAAVASRQPKAAAMLRPIA